MTSQTNRTGWLILVISLIGLIIALIVTIYKSNKQFESLIRKKINKIHDLEADVSRYETESLLASNDKSVYLFKMKSTKSELEKYQLQVSGLRTIIDELRRKIEIMTLELEGKTSELDEYDISMSEFKRQDDYIIILQEEIAKHKEIVQEQEDRLKEFNSYQQNEQTIVELRQVINNKYDEMKQLQEQFEANVRSLSDSENKAEENIQNELAKNNQILLEQSARYYELEMLLKQKEKIIEEINEQMSARDNNIFNMQGSIDELERIKELYSHSEAELENVLETAKQFENKADNNFQLAINIEKRAVEAETDLNLQIEIVNQLQAKIAELESLHTIGVGEETNEMQNDGQETS